MSEQQSATNYPQWVCMPCGMKHGNRPPGIATWHIDECGICKKQTAVTEPRDFGHLKDDWSAHVGAIGDDQRSEQLTCSAHVGAL